MKEHVIITIAVGIATVLLGIVFVGMIVTCLSQNKTIENTKKEISMYHVNIMGDVYKTGKLTGVGIVSFFAREYSDGSTEYDSIFFRDNINNEKTNINVKLDGEV